MTQFHITDVPDRSSGDMNEIEATKPALARQWHNLLQELSSESEKSAARIEHDETNWRRRGFWLSLLAAIGSAFAAGAVAVGNLDNDTLRAAIVVAAILGAGLSGVAAAIGAPEQADKLAREARSLHALSRWAIFEKLRHPNTTEEAEQRLVAFYSWHDAIAGVEVPVDVRNRENTFQLPAEE